MTWGAKNPPLDPTVSFSGKTVLVTGCNTGLGFEAALKYSSLGADKLILAVRSVQKGEDTKARILAKTGRDPSSISYLLVDLSTFASVQQFAIALEKEVAETGGLDIALFSAGVSPPKYATGPDGHEMAVQVNILSTTYMAELVFPLLLSTAQKKGRANLTFVNSNGNDMVERKWFDGYSGGLLQWADDPKTWNAMRSYTTVKLIGLAAMMDLAKRTAGQGVVVNAVCPGMCKTDLGRDFPWVQRVLMGVASNFISRTAEEGGRSLDE
ncbi:hypothetical protein OQA88_4281 [Cercophora sp. LCS_1]